MHKLFSILSFLLLYAIITYGQPNVNIPLTISDGNYLNNNLAIGVDTAATNGIDIDLGEAELPPFPPAGSFEVRFDLEPYTGLPLHTYKDYRNAPSLPFTGVVEHKLIWQLSAGATTFQITYSLTPEATLNIKDLLGGILFDSGELSGSGTYAIPTAFIGLNNAIFTLTVGEPCPIVDASVPTPNDLETGVALSGTTLEWTNGAGSDNVEVWFGPNGRTLKLYDGPAINSWPLGSLNYGTLYSWYIVGKDNFCEAQSPTWTFTTILDTSLVIDTIIVYPKNLSNWTGSCSPSNKTQVSLVNGYNTEVGWMAFDVTAIPNNVTINAVEFNGYLFENSWPYWSITPMGSINPITDPAFSIFNQVSNNSSEGIAYSYNEESATLTNGWITRQLGSGVALDLKDALSKNWFALGILDFDFSTSYYVKFQGWAEENKPYLKVIYSFHGSTAFQFSKDVSDGWNLVSIPGLLPGTQNVNNWWQYRDMNSPVYKYQVGYQPVTTVNPGSGYWMKHTGDRLYNTGEEWPGGGIIFVPHNPIDVNSGWNLFGGYEELLLTAGITTAPPGLIGGPIYGYSGGYYVANQIQPGSGYWVKLSGPGQLFLPDPESSSKQNKIVDWFPDEWGRIIFTDASGKNFTLYSVKGEVNLDQYELPPTPLGDMFDIRFSSGRIAEDIEKSIKFIDLSGIVFPLTIKAAGINIKVMDVSGKILNTNLKNGENIVIDNSTVNKLMVTGELVPAVYSLEQNYPNPFNPSTTIEFSLPEDVSSVKLSIYNPLGEKVAEIVNSSLTAGKYNYQWNAQNLATGMYIYELRTDKFVSVKKMVLMK